MPYKRLPATENDTPDIVTVYDAAFKNDQFVGQLMANADPEAKRIYDIASMHCDRSTD